MFFFVFSVSLCRGNPVRGDRTENQTKWWWQEQKLLSGQKIKPMTINNKNRTMVCLCEKNPLKFHLKIWWVGCKKHDERKESVVHERGTFSVILHWIIKCSSFLWSVSPWQNWHGFFLHWALGTLPWYKTSFEPNSCGQQDWYNI